MEYFRKFLEASTIHGLVYISTTRKYVRLFWIFVVIAGFLSSGVIIYQSFQSWEESPITTTIETIPSKKLTFPKVSVCPPKNTLTDLNYDLDVIRNLTLDSDTRKKLANYAAELIFDHFHD